MIAKALVAAVIFSMLLAAPAEASSPHVRGWASWYRWHPRQAAAGPALRRMLGPHWRGRWVTVHFIGHRVSRRVKLTDWCACGPRRGIPTVIDLNLGSFPWPSRGIVLVTVTP